MLRWVFTFLGVVLVIAFVYFRTLASVEELAPKVPETPAESAARGEPELDDAQATLVDAARAPLEGAPETATVPGRALALRGRVLTPTGKPCDGATLRFATVRHGRAELERTKSGPDGRFELTLAAPDARGDLLVTVQGHEFAPVARLDVAAGTQELVLVLAPPRTFTVRFVDAQGFMHEPHEVSFHWMLAGVTRADEDDALGRLRWSRSPVPFRIHVNDAQLQDEWLGPFEPDAVGDELVVDVQRRAFVRGVVLAGGAPVAQATVRLEAVARTSDARGRTFGNGSTNEQGEFWFRVDAPGIFRPVAFHPAHGRGRGPEFSCDDADVEGLTLELDEPPGWIEGHLLLPAGRDPALVAVELEHRARTLRADGSFLLPEVEPGQHVLRLVGGDPGDPRDHWTWYRGLSAPGFAYTPTWTVEVRSGVATSVALDLSAPQPVRLQGRIELGQAVADASTFGNREGVGVSFWREGGTELESQAALAPPGEFRVEFATPGRRRLEFQLQLGAVAEHGSWRVRDVLDLGPGDQRWELALVPGALRLVAPEVDLWLEPEPTLHWQDAGELTIDVPGSLSGVVASTPGSLLYSAVPPGRVTFQLVPGGATYAASVRPGETSEFVFPESAAGELRAAYDARATGLERANEEGFY